MASLPILKTSNYGLLHNSPSLVALLLILGIPAALIVIPLFKNVNFQWPRLPQSIALVTFFFVFIYLNLLILALFVVFNYGT